MQAGAIGHDGQAMVLDMGTPVKIVDVAHELIALSGKDVEIQFTGLGPGEKLTQVLFMTDEAHQPTSHPMMAAVDVPSLHPQALMRLQAQDSAAVRRAFDAVGDNDASDAAV